MGRVRILIAGASSPGVRDKNDDHFCVGDKVGQKRQLSLRIDTDNPWIQRVGVLAAVADGMGSYEGGALASQTVLSELTEDYYSMRHSDFEKRLHGGLGAALKRLQTVLKRAKRKQAGTTVAGIALLPPELLLVFHVGDSRVYRLRRGHLKALTIDHTPVGLALAKGEMTLDEAVGRRDAFQLTRSFGLIGNTQVEVRKGKFRPGDRYAIMSDGVSSPGRGLDQVTLADYLTKARPAEDLLEPMLTQAVRQDGDNATLVILEIRS